MATTAVANINKTIFNESDWFEGCYFIDPNGALRFAVDYAYFRQKYLDGVKSTNNRVGLSAWYLF